MTATVECWLPRLLTPATGFPILTSIHPGPPCPGFFLALPPLVRVGVSGGALVASAGYVGGAPTSGGVIPGSGCGHDGELVRLRDF